jgi:4-oxalocrotonate tautomerase
MFINRYNCMPSVDVKVWKGISEDAVEKIISGITKVFVDIGIPERAVEVIVYEIPKSHWGVGGRPSSKGLPDEKPP